MDFDDSDEDEPARNVTFLTSAVIESVPDKGRPLKVANRPVHRDREETPPLCRSNGQVCDDNIQYLGSFSLVKEEDTEQKKRANCLTVNHLLVAIFGMLILLISLLVIKNAVKVHLSHSEPVTIYHDRMQSLDTLTLLAASQATWQKRSPAPDESTLSPFGLYGGKNPGLFHRHWPVFMGHRRSKPPGSTTEIPSISLFAVKFYGKRPTKSPAIIRSTLSKRAHLPHRVDNPQHFCLYLPRGRSEKTLLPFAITLYQINDWVR